jgi:hypothetical protein
MTFKRQIGEYRVACDHSGAWKIESGLMEKGFKFEAGYDT